MRGNLLLIAFNCQPFQKLSMWPLKEFLARSRRWSMESYKTVSLGRPINGGVRHVAILDPIRESALLHLNFRVGRLQLPVTPLHPLVRTKLMPL